MTFYFDTAQRSCVVVCSCGARHGTSHRAAARRWAAQHEAETHPGQFHARKALSEATRRADL